MHYTVVVITIEKGHVFSDQFERTVPDRLLLQSVLCLSCMPDKFLNVDYFSIWDQWYKYSRTVIM